MILLGLVERKQNGLILKHLYNVNKSDKTERETNYRNEPRTNAFLDFIMSGEFLGLLMCQARGTENLLQRPSFPYAIDSTV